jgi:carbon monoxide dehydrogenase subunit G
MKLEQSFTVNAPLDQVWSALTDVERVAPCLPGAEITGRDDGGSYHGSFSVKIGPTSAAYNGVLKMESADDAAHVATMSARGTDKRGQGGATATIVSTLVEENGATRVDVDTDFTITGKLARFGRGGMIQDVSKRLMRDFASCLQETLAAERAAPEAAGAGAGAVAAGGPSGAEPQGAVATGIDAATDAGAAGQPTPAAASGGSATAAGMPVSSAGGSAAAGGAGAAGAPPRSTPPRPTPTPAKPVNAFSLMLSILGERLKRLLPALANAIKRLAPVVLERVKPLADRLRRNR